MSYDPRVTSVCKSSSIPYPVDDLFLSLALKLSSSLTVVLSLSTCEFCTALEFRTTRRLCLPFSYRFLSPGPDDKKDYVIITARESVPVLQARRAQEAAAKELAEKKRRHVYQNVNGGAATGVPAPMDDSSDSENYAKV